MTVTNNMSFVVEIEEVETHIFFKTDGEILDFVILLK